MMRIWRWVVAEVTILAVMACGIALSTEQDLLWLRVVSLGVGAFGTATLVMTLKRWRQRATRSSEPDSVETAQDLTARAGAYLDGLLLVAAALVVSTFWDGVPSPVLLLALLAAYAISYWIRRAFGHR